MIGTDMQRSARFSEDGTLRYTLERVWDLSKSLVMFCLLNPSKADAERDDATVRKCMGFAERWGYGGILVGNVSPYRATDPRELVKAWKRGVNVFPDENGPFLTGLAKRSDVVVCGWGAAPIAQGQRAAIASLLGPYNLRCLKTTNDGAPYHPLYLPYTSELKPWPVTA